MATLPGIFQQITPQKNVKKLVGQTIDFPLSSVLECDKFRVDSHLCKLRDTPAARLSYGCCQGEFCSRERTSAFILMAYLPDFSWITPEGVGRGRGGAGYTTRSCAFLGAALCCFLLARKAMV